MDEEQTDPPDTRMVDVYKFAGRLPPETTEKFTEIHDLAVEAQLREVVVQELVYVPCFRRLRYFAHHPDMIGPYLFRVRVVSKVVKERHGLRFD